MSTHTNDPVDLFVELSGLTEHNTPFLNQAREFCNQIVAVYALKMDFEDGSSCIINIWNYDRDLIQYPHKCKVLLIPTPELHEGELH